MPSAVLSNDEVRFVLELFAVLDRGGDPRVLLRSDIARSTRRKFLLLSQSIEPRREA